MRGGFGFLAGEEPQLARLGALSERYFHDDPATALIKLRQFAETMAALVAARNALAPGPRDSFDDILRRLREAGRLPREAGDLPRPPPARQRGGAREPRDSRPGADRAEAGPPARRMVPARLRGRPRVQPGPVRSACTADRRGCAAAEGDRGASGQAQRGAEASGGGNPARAGAGERGPAPAAPSRRGRLLAGLRGRSRAREGDPGPASRGGAGARRRGACAHR